MKILAIKSCQQLHISKLLLRKSFLRHNGSASSSRLKDLPAEADTVIVGGGVAGTSIAYHLAKQSNQSVVLLEKSNITEGSTWHAAGLVTLYHPGINVKRLHWYSINFYSQLERETGQQVGFHRPGSLRLATTPTRVDEMRYQMSRQGWNLAPQRMVEPDEVKEMVPIVDVDGANILAGLFTPGDGHIDPYSLTQAIAKGARKYGAQIFQQTGVTNMNLREDGQWEVTTDSGRIIAKKVVNACGFWAREFGKLCGLDLPLVPMHHQYLVTSSVPEVQALKQEIPVLRHLEGSFYLRQERDGLLIGPYESVESCRACEDWALDRVPPGFGRELFEPDLDRLQPHLEQAMTLVPCFQNAKIQSVVNGPITYSPDVLPMVGPSMLPNMWLAVGFSYGIVHGGGIGKYLADWMLNGEASFDLTELDPLRYGKWTNIDYVITKSKESYGMNNAVGFPHEERWAGRPTYRVSGIYEETKAAGGFMGFHAGWEQPDWYAEKGSSAEYKPSFRRTNWFDAVQREYKHITSKVGIIDLSPFAKFIVKGPQAREYLDYLVAGTVPKPGRTTLAHALTPKGKVYAELTLTGLPENQFMIVTGSGSELHDLRHINQVAREKGFDIEVENITDNTGVLSIVGPNSRDLLADVIGDKVLANGWKFLDAKKILIGGIECLAVRISYTGELGWEIYIPMDKMKQVYQEIISKGIQHGLEHFGTFTVNTLRIEKGFKMWGSEMNCDVTIVEAGLEGFVKMNKKSDFIGKKAVQECFREFQNQRCTMLEVEVDDVDPEGNHSIWANGKVVGNTTSGCFSPALGKGLAFCYIPAFLDVPGTEVEVEMLGKRNKARVLDGPPVLTQPAREKNQSS